MVWFRKPGEFQSLVNHQIDKFKNNEKHPEGEFWLALRLPSAKFRDVQEIFKISKDPKQVPPPLPSIILISHQPGKPIDKNYYAVAEKGDKETIEAQVTITGSYKYEAVKKSYSFMFDEKSAAEAKKARADPRFKRALDVTLWQFVPVTATAIQWYPKPVGGVVKIAQHDKIEKPVVKSDTVEITHWDLRWLLRWIAQNEEKKPLPAGLIATKDKEGALLYQGVDSPWPFENVGLPTVEIAPVVKGDVVLALEGDPTLHQMFYDLGWEAAKEHGRALKKKLDAIDADIRAGKVARANADALVKKAISEFETALTAKVAQDVDNSWQEYTKANGQYLRYKLKAGFTLAAKVAGLVVSLTTTILAGWTGAGTVVGAIGAAKATAGIARDALLLWITADTLGAKLVKSMTSLQKKVADESPNLTGAKEVLAGAIQRLTGYQKESIGPFQKDLDQYKEKIVGCLAKAQEASKSLTPTITTVGTAAKEVERKLNEEYQAAYDVLLATPNAATGIDRNAKLVLGDAESDKVGAKMTAALAKLTTPKGVETYLGWKLIVDLGHEVVNARKQLDATLTMIAGKAAQGSQPAVRGLMEMFTENRKKADEMTEWVKSLQAAKQVPEWAEKVNKFVLPLLDIVMTGVGTIGAASEKAGVTVAEVAAKQILKAELLVGLEVTLVAVGDELQAKDDRGELEGYKKRWSDFASEVTSKLGNAAGSAKFYKELIKAMIEAKIKG